MGANRIGQLYYHTHRSITLRQDRGSHILASAIGSIEQGEVFLVVAKAEWPDLGWLQVLVGGRLGWIYAEALNLVWVDPEEEQ
jgi:hypothetical protein